MAKTLKEHLAEYDYEYTDYDREHIDEEAAEAKWQERVATYGEDNVWDYRILSDAFETNNACFSYGFMFGVVRKSDGKKGSLNQDGSNPGVPRFYFGFKESF